LPNEKDAMLNGVSPLEYVSPFRSMCNQDILHNMGLALYFLKKYDEAFEFLQQAIKISRLSPNVKMLFI